MFKKKNTWDYKKETFFFKKKRERQTCKDIFVFFWKKKHTKKYKDQTCRSFQIRVLERGHRQRKHEKEKENTDEQRRT